MPAKRTKTVVVRARVTKAMKDAVVEHAGTIGDSVSGECEAVVVREALGEYFAKRGIKVADEPPVRVMRETISPKQSARYSRPSRKRRAQKHPANKK